MINLVFVAVALKSWAHSLIYALYTVLLLVSFKLKGKNELQKEYLKI